MKKLNLILIVSILFAFCSNAQNWNQIIKAEAPSRLAADYFGYSVAIHGDYAIVGARFEEEDANELNRIDNAGSAYIFKQTSGVWALQQKIVASDRGIDDRFGSSVSIYGDYAIVGVALEDEDVNGANTMNGAGSAYIFKQINGVWTQQQKIVASDRATSDNFGFSVSISGDYVIVGAYFEDEDANGTNTMSSAGSAYIFKQTGGVWTQQQKIVASDRAASDNFGYSVSLSGNSAIVGARFEDEDASGANTMSSAGSAYIFKQTGGVWTQQQKIVASDRADSDNFGYSVSVSGDYTIIGAYVEDEDASGANTISNAGSAYIFKETEGVWTQQQKIVASDRAATDNFGYSVSVSGDYAIIGAYLEDEDANGTNTMSNAGSAYIFKQTEGVWTQQQKIVALDRTGNDRFGSSVAVNGNNAIVGAPLNNFGVNQADAGCAYIFKQNTPIWTGAENTDWNNVNNWQSGSVPSAAEDVTIPSEPSGGNFPEIEVNTQINSITIESNAEIFIALGINFTISGAYTNNGIFFTSPGNYILTTNNSNDIVISSVTCPAGSFCSNGIDAILCDGGFFSSTQGSTSCIPCNAGTYQDELGSTSCTPCAAGTFQSNTGAVNCIACAPGTFASEEGQVSCSSCPAETYQPNASSIECLSCPGQPDFEATECNNENCATTATIAEAELILLCNLQTRTLTVNFDGEVDAIQWYRRGQAISGATTANLLVNRWTIGDVYAEATCNGSTIESNRIFVNSILVRNQDGTDANWGKICNSQPTTLSVPLLAGHTYLWRERGTNTVVSTTHEFTVSGAEITPHRSYDVFVTSASGCTKSTKLVLVSGGTCPEVTIETRPETSAKTSMTSGNETVSLMFYPNPVTDKYVISLSGLSEDESFAVNWYDMTGKQVKATEMITTGTGREATQNIGNLAKGIYVVKVDNANHQFTFRVMVQ